MKSIEFSDSLQNKTAQTPKRSEVIVDQAVMGTKFGHFSCDVKAFCPQLSTDMGVRTQVKTYIKSQTGLEKKNEWATMPYGV